MFPFSRTLLLLSPVLVDFLVVLEGRPCQRFEGTLLAAERVLFGVVDDRVMPEPLFGPAPLPALLARESNFPAVVRLHVPFVSFELKGEQLKAKNSATTLSQDIYLPSR